MAERVRRLAPPRVHPRVDVACSAAAELIVCATMITSTDEHYDVGSEWFHDARTSMGSELSRQVALFQDSGPGAVWHTLLAAVAEAPTSLPEFIDHLEAMPTDELWLQMLGYHDQVDPSPELREAMLAAGRGMVEPLERWFEREPSRIHWVHGLARGLGGDAVIARRVVLDLLARLHREVFAALWAEIAPILERDAEEKRRLAAERRADEVVEEATNGGEYVPEAGISRLLLVPTYLGRPWVNLNRQRDTLVIVHPVGDAALTGSAEEARRRQVLRLAKALSDDTRLRALRLMSGSNRSLQELADELGIRKSTMHHHLAVLRAAGLLRLRFFEKRYSLRTAPVAGMSGLLGEYLGEGGIDRDEHRTARGAGGRAAGRAAPRRRAERAGGRGAAHPLDPPAPGLDHGADRAGGVAPGAAECVAADLRGPAADGPPAWCRLGGMATSDDVRLNAVVRGDVQGVGFRYFVLERVRGGGLRGWVRNGRDGSVEVVAEGPRPVLEALLGELRRGPRSAAVSEVEVDWQPARGDLPAFRVSS